jgi:hypothetical protein
METTQEERRLRTELHLCQGRVYDLSELVDDAKPFVQEVAQSEGPLAEAAKEWLRRSR